MNQINIVEHVINKLAKQVLKEAGFRQYPKNKQTQDKRKYLKIESVKFTKRFSAKKNTEIKCIAVTLANTNPDNLQILKDNINNISRQKFVFQALIENSPVTKQPTVVILFNLNTKEEIPNLLPELEITLKNLNDYNEKSIDVFCREIYYRIDAIVTDEDEIQAEERSINNWKELLSLLHDPQIKNKLLLYQTTDNYARTYGHILSPRNVKKVLDQCPTATFVLESSSWLKYYNRRVKPGAQRIIVIKAVAKKNKNQQVLDKMAQQYNHSNYRDFSKDKEIYTQQISHAINILAQKNIAFFETVIMYDVADTIPIDPQNDKWTNEIGLSNHLNGELNAAAQKYDATHRQDDIQQHNLQQSNIAQQYRIQNIAQSITEQCNKILGQDVINTLKQKYTDNNNNLDYCSFIREMCVKYTEHMAHRYQIVTPEDIKHLTILVVSVIILSIDDDSFTIPSDYMSFLRQQKPIPETLAVTAFNILTDLIVQINIGCRVQNKNIKVDPNVVNNNINN